MGIKIEDILNAVNTKKQASTIDTQSNKTPFEFVSDFELDDDGEEYMPVGVEGLLAASEKLLAINRGMVEPDERDSMKFQKIVRPHTMFKEGIKMDAGKISRQIMYQASKRKNLNGVGPNAFMPYIDRVLKGNPLTSPLEEINPMQLVENARRITKMGPGGIPSDESITEEAQSVHPSQFAFICPISGPESARAGIDTRAAWGTKVGSNGRLYQVLFDRRDGKYKWMSPQDVADLVVKIPD